LEPNARQFSQAVHVAVSKVTAAMNLIMVDAAKRDGELVAYPAAQRAWLGKAEMVGLARMTPAHKAWLRRYEFVSTRGRGGSAPKRRGGSPLSTQRQNFFSAVSSKCW
jgi:hypothetical protein